MIDERWDEAEKKRDKEGEELLSRSRVGGFIEHSGSRGPVVVPGSTRDSSLSRSAAIEGLAQSIRAEKSRCVETNI